MSRIPVRVHVDTGALRATVDGWVDAEAVARAEDGIGVRVEVESVLGMSGRAITAPTFPPELVDSYMTRELSKGQALDRLASLWRSGSWPLYATADEIEDRRLVPLPGSQPLMEVQ